MTRVGAKRGLLISFEGIDGCGKTTQAMLTYQFLKSHGYRRVQMFREPGSTPVAEQIRSILLDKKSSPGDVTEILLYEAARAELVAKELSPALSQGQIVLCDRYFDSTTAYQGYGRRLDLRMVRSLHRVAVGSIVPDLTLLFDVDLKTAAARRGKKRDRLESESNAFHQRVRKGFLEIARKDRRRLKVIDGAPSPSDVFKEVQRYLQKKLRIHGPGV